MSEKRTPLRLAEIVPLKVEDAQKATERPARKCWPWSHSWTMWDRSLGGLHQTRRCLGCGWRQIR